MTSLILVSFALVACADDSNAPEAAHGVTPPAQLEAIARDAVDEAPVGTEEPSSPPTDDEAPQGGGPLPEVAAAESELDDQPRRVAPRASTRTSGRVRLLSVDRVSGPGDPELVRRGVSSRSRSMLACYERLAGSADLRGEVDLRVTFDATGRPSAASVERDTLHDGDVNACLLRNMHQLPQDAASEGTFDVRLLFAPDRETPI